MGKQLCDYLKAMEEAKNSDEFAAASTEILGLLEDAKKVFKAKFPPPIGRIFVPGGGLEVTKASAFGQHTDFDSMTVSHEGINVTLQGVTTTIPATACKAVEITLRGDE